jgi:MFS family permease
MKGSLGLNLLNKRRFLPLFATQFLNAFNDNLYKTAMVMFVVYNVLADPDQETWFSAIATGVFTIPFFALSALSGQLADATDKARIIRIVKGCEIGIMAVGAAGLTLGLHGIAINWLAIPLMLLALFAMGVHSTFFSPIKYAILPQHLHKDEVLGGTGLVEAGTYLAILTGTILSGIIPFEVSTVLILVVAVIGYMFGRRVPPAPALEEGHKIDWNVLRSSVTLVRATTHIPRVFMAIVAISFFWTIGAVLFILFPPMVKNTLMGDRAIVSMFLAVFSVGVSIGSVVINRMLKGEVSARYSAPSVIVMGLFILAFYQVTKTWQASPADGLLSFNDFMVHPGTIWLSLCLLGIAISGGMFVVPLYAFLTTTVKKSEAARTIAANKIVNSLAMVIGSALSTIMSLLAIAITEQLLLAAVMCLMSAWLAWKLHKVADDKVFVGATLPDDV